MLINVGRYEGERADAPREGRVSRNEELERSVPEPEDAPREGRVSRNDCFGIRFFKRCTTRPARGV